MQSCSFMTPSRTDRLATLLSIGFVAALGSACGAPPSAPAVATPTASAASAPSAESASTKALVCDLYCERASVIVSRPPNAPDYTALETENANRVLDAIRPELLKCYAKRLAIDPKVRAYVMLEVVVDKQGHVMSAEGFGGGMLGAATMECIVNRVKRAAFDPPHGGGTLKIQMPFTLRPTAAEESI